MVAKWVKIDADAGVSACIQRNHLTSVSIIADAIITVNTMRGKPWRERQHRHQ